MSRNFRDINRNSKYLFPESVDEWLPEDHLARFVVELVDSLDIRTIESAYRKGGVAAGSRRGQTYTFDIFTYFTQLTQLRRGQIGSLVSN